MKSREGHLALKNGKWVVRYFLGEGKRPSLALPTCTTEEQALARMKVIVEHVNTLCAIEQFDLAQKIAKKAAIARYDVELDAVARAVRAIVLGEAKPRVELTGTMTLREFGEKWTSGELHEAFPTRVRKKKTSKQDEGLLGLHVYPLIGDVPVNAVTGEHGEHVLARLPKGLTESSVRHVAQALSKLMTYAVFPAKLVAASPFPKGFVPTVTKRPAFTYLYPDEDTEVLACEEIPLIWRFLYGFLAREGLRVGEAKQLEWSDIDLRRGALNLDKTKTDDPRMWAIDPGVHEALRRWRKIAPSQRWLFAYPDGTDILSAGRADEFRQHVKLAGIHRPQITERTADRRPLRIHDLRATFVTVSLSRGRNERWVCDRTGHRSSNMVARYMRIARTHAELDLGELVSLAEGIPELKRVA